MTTLLLIDVQKDFHGGSLAIPSASDDALRIASFIKKHSSSISRIVRFQLCIWKEHCLIGSEGHNVVQVVMDAMTEWCDATGGSVEWVNKGEDNFTDMCSAMAAEVPVSSETAFGYDLFHSRKKRTDKLIICGQALSHCVKYTVRDIVQRWPKDQMDKLTVLRDCTTPVPGSEMAGERLLSDMRGAGVNVETSETFQC
mmetsp:Transcript_7454/g.13049  ORF Transcript_7454/g.13049 Transcript_7454/m.13049 type:complete len:198 (+) Transcript_7454:341-934(+)